MGKVMKIPVKAVQSANGDAIPGPAKAEDRSAGEQAVSQIRAGDRKAETRYQANTNGQKADEVPTAEHASGEEWRERALRLQAEMENYRKRQRRLAKEQIDTEREQLLRSFLSVVDNLERALSAPDGDYQAMREGIQLTHRAALQLLGREGAEPIHTDNQPFDPNWHEAVATVRHSGTGTDANTIVQTTEPGYRLGDKLLRPAKVVVAI